MNTVKLPKIRTRFLIPPRKEPEDRRYAESIHFRTIFSLHRCKTSISSREKFQFRVLHWKQKYCKRIAGHNTNLFCRSKSTDGQFGLVVLQFWRFYGKISRDFLQKISDRKHLSFCLCCLSSTLKSFQASLFAFRLNLFTAVAPFSHGFLTLSVVRKSVLREGVVRAG